LKRLYENGPFINIKSKIAHGLGKKDPKYLIIDLKRFMVKIVNDQNRVKNSEVFVLKGNIVYGPVPSRRLGRSLGVDLVPYKVCSYDCVYCQLGSTGQTVIERKPYIPLDAILSQLSKKLKSGVKADFITLAGSGEPTLNSELGDIIKEIRKISDLPLSLITNGSLFWDERVRKAAVGADLVLPSLDAWDQKGFETINRPNSGIMFNEMAEGLVTFSREYSGAIWLEIFLLEGINSTEEDAGRFREWIKRMDPERVQINTAVRPPAERKVSAVDMPGLDNFCRLLGEKAEIVASFKDHDAPGSKPGLEADILELLERRPCTLEDISSGLGVHRNEVIKYLDSLLSTGQVEQVERESAGYYRVRRDS